MSFLCTNSNCFSLNKYQPTKTLPPVLSLLSPPEIPTSIFPGNFYFPGKYNSMEEDEVVPDDLRCHRTDGRKWRCTRRVKENKKLCELHYIQGRHRQYKQTVPPSLKLKRKPNKKRKPDSEIRKNPEIRARKREKLLKKAANGVEGRTSVDVSEALDEALKKMKLKRGDLQLELIREFLKRQVEKKKEERELEKELERDGKGDIMRELPYGVMAISPSPSPEFFCNAGSLNVKLGLDSSPLPRRFFRSKNIAPLPIGSMQIVPYARNVGNLRRGRRKKCHWCRKSGYRILIKCSSCRKEFFCTDCIGERYCDKQEVKMACPVCCRTCSCRACSKKSKDVDHKDPFRNRKKVDKIHLLHYLIFTLLPILKEINQDQNAELEIEAEIKGKAPSEIQIQQVELSCGKLNCCSNCKSSIVNFHRRCTNCSYKLCLSCCWEICRRSIPKSTEAFISTCPNRRKSYVSGPTSLLNLKASVDGSIYCPPVNHGGCGNSFLDLRYVFPFTWTKELELSAEEIVCSYDFPEAFDVSSSCTICSVADHKAGSIKVVRGVASREDSSDNFLYCPTTKNLNDEDLEHFQKHWKKGHPVRVRNVLQSAAGLSWDPVAMFCTYLEKSSANSRNDKETVKATNCLDWCEVDIGIRQIFMGSLEGRTHANMWRETLKFKGWLSSHLFQEQFPAHYTEILHSLPLKEYMDPVSGLLNLAVKLPLEMPKPDLGPCIYISFGGPEELMQPDFLTKLRHDSNDVVNILAHATDVPVSTEQFSKIKDLMEGYRAQDHRESPRSTTDEKSTSESKGKSSLHSKGTEDLASHNLIGEGLHLLNGVSKVSSDASNVREQEDDSKSDSEASIISSQTIQSSEELDNQISNCSRKEPPSDSCGAQWDIFRRQDVPKLLEYIKRHSNEFSHSYCLPTHVVHPILDQSFFLDTAHKMRLKQEFNVEPWTFEQHTGEAVIIPAGCPYQIRKLKSCVNVVLDFISPESAIECINLIDELRLLPLQHKAKEKTYEVKKMTLYGVSAAIKEIHNLMGTE